MSKELPKWVWDMIIGLLEQEDIHPKLYQQVDAKYPEQGYSYQLADWCAGVPLNQVPAEVRSQAEAIRTYNRMAEKDKQEGDASGS